MIYTNIRYKILHFVCISSAADAKNDQNYKKKLGKDEVRIAHQFYSIVF